MRNNVIMGALCAGGLGMGCVGGSVAAGGKPSGAATPSPVAAIESPKPVVKGPVKRLTAFASDAELVAFLRETVRAERLRREAQAQKMADAGVLAKPAMEMKAQATPAPAGKAEGAKEDESVTNVQHAGVDEGGIVKVRGEHLVVLRRGRLFTVRIGDDSLTPVSAVDAFGPDIDPGGTWYDEMLVSDDTIVVVGYSYQRGGTELGLFDLDRQGGIRYRATYHLRSNDYYSSRNYASRLLGRKLVFYTPLYVWPDEQAPLRYFPALRKWHSGATESEFRPIYTPRRIYRPLTETPTLALHTVTVCDLGRAQDDLACAATAVMGPPGRVFYVSPTAVYVWMTDGSWHSSASRSLLYQLPLEGGDPRAIRVSGSPIDQFSFLEEDDTLNVLLRADAAGDGMWRAEVSQGDVALLRLPLESFAAEVAEARVSRYRALPKPDGYVFQNRFVGDYVLYGSGNGWGSPRTPSSDRLFATRYAGGQPVTLSLGHGVDRIEALGTNAIVVGTDGRDLHFSPVSLGDRPFVADRYTRPDAAQGELRSHGFFYKAESEDAGILGLPVRGAGRPGYEHLFRDSMSILFVRNDSLHLSELGELTPRTKGVTSDACRASCVDWYGNARPLFLRGRIFALLGYEIVEGRISADRGTIEERRRVSFAPGRVAVTQAN